ncbi:MAG: S46 family peptidase [Bacteroidales bacterium]|nr:S46 family peptidase [Bacteroidales bacterium]
MKKFLISLAALLAGVAAFADEGMWLLPLLQKFNEEAMRNIGSRLTAEDIYNINNSSLKDAIVQFGGGCTGEMISKDGLLVTNHHCGYSAIQKLSTPEHNYLEDGFFALKREDEIPAPGMSVMFLVKMEDVTGVADKPAYLKKVKAQLSKEGPGRTAQIVSFYNDNVQYLIVYKVFKDIRFVGAPPASLGKFGGETDNWMWPRHTCDFSMFRVYADADGNPADFSPANKPYHPERSLKISLKGVKENDFAFILGYPGRTQRFQTAAQLESMIAINRIKIDARTVRQKVMREEMEKDPAVRLQYANKYASSSNGWKKWQGEELAFAKLNIIGRELEKEKALPEGAEAVKKIAEIVEKGQESYAALTLLNETLSRIERVNFCELKPGDPKLKDYNEAVDRRIAEALIAHYNANVNPKYKLNVPKVADLYSNSKKGIAACKTLAEDIEKQFEILWSEARTMRDDLKPRTKAFAAALLKANGDNASYPDANFTMRLTYGTVLPYSPKDGVSYWYYTTSEGVLEKENPDDYEFRVPAKAKELMAAKDFGRYADENGRLVTCFLTNCDITGGNSGSPVMDASGNLIGLAFDGNWESMSSDVMFEPDLQRCICVDIRYVLWTVEKFGGAGNLIDELEFVI